MPSSRTTTSPYLPQEFLLKSPEQLRQELFGFADHCVAAMLRFQANGELAAFWQALPGLIDYHLPSRCRTSLPDILTDDLRLQQDLGLDSLALTEMVFKLDELMGIALVIREMAPISTVGQLKAFLTCKLNSFSPV